MAMHEVFSRMIGHWKGTCRTWFEPEQLADESELAGQIQAVLGGRFIRHIYHGSIQGKQRSGEELIAFNSITDRFQVIWIDDFHMSDAIMVSEGGVTANGFGVRGEYDVAPGVPRWGWRTDYDVLDDNHLRLVAFNIDPDGMEAKALETHYRRQIDE